MVPAEVSRPVEHLARLPKTIQLLAQPQVQMYEHRFPAQNTQETLVKLLRVVFKLMIASLLAMVYQAPQALRRDPQV